MDKKLKTRARKRKSELLRRLNNPEKFKLQALSKQFKLKYNITIADYENLHKKQNGMCSICKKHFDLGAKGNHRLHVDHCHKTNRVRGLLCFHCNTLIGRIENNLNKMKRICNYLRLNFSDLK